MTRRDELLATLDLAVGAGVAASRATGNLSIDAYGLALDAFDASWAQERALAAQRSTAALLALPARWADDPVAAVMACAGAGLATAGIGVAGEWTSSDEGRTPTGDPIADALPLLGLLPDGAEGAFASIALAEAAIACARIDLAGRIATGVVPGALVDRGGAEHPFAAIAGVLIARIAAFNGRIDEASVVVSAIRPTGIPGVDRLVHGTASLVGGNAADAGAASALVAELELARLPDRPSRLDTGPLLLVSFGLVAVGEVRRAAGLALRIIGTDHQPMIVDRMLAIEIALAAAVLDGDVDAAQAWESLAEPFAADRIAASTVARMRSRVALLAGDSEAAIAHADRAIDIATTDGRAIEVAEGEIVAARARIAAGRMGEAGRRLSTVAADGDRAGHRAVRRAATATLRTAGRRLPPEPGSGDASLSPRELEVHDLLVRGLGNAEIAAMLHLSPHTVRVHVSRVLAAHAAPTRFALVAVDAARRARGGNGTAGSSGAPGSSVLEPLTVRQRAVVEQLLTGASNPEIAGRLGIAVRTVEKHLGAVMHAWSATGRSEVVAIASGAPLRPIRSEPVEPAVE